MYTIDPTIIKNSHELVMYSRSIILIFFICIFIIGLLLILINFYKKCKKFSINNLINYFLIFFASFFIQSVYISDLEIYPDEVIYLSCSITLSNDYSWVFNNLYSIPILSFLIWSVWINLFPYLSSLVVCRTVSIVFNGFTIIFIHKITKRLLDNKIANLSVLFLIFSPFLMSINSFLLLESIALFFITITIFYCLKMESNLKENKSAYKYTILTGILFGFAISSKYFAVLLLPIFTLYFLKIDKKSRLLIKIKHFKNLLIIVIISVIIMFLIWPWLFTNITYIIIGYSVRIISGHPFYFFGQYTENPPFYSIFIYMFEKTSFVSFIFAYIGLGIFIYYVITKKISNIKNFYIIFLWNIVYLVFLSFSYVKLIHYIIYLIPSNSIFAGLGIYHTYKYLKNKISLTNSNTLKVKLRKSVPYIICGFFVSYQVSTVFIYYPNYNLFYDPITGGLKTGTFIFPISTGTSSQQIYYWIDENLNKSDKILYLGSYITLNFYNEKNYTITYFFDIFNETTCDNLSQFLALNYSYFIIQIVIKTTIDNNIVRYVYENTTLVKEITLYSTTIAWIYRL